MRHSRLSLGVVSLALGFPAAGASAQNTTCVFTIDEASSVVTWKGALSYPKKLSESPVSSWNLSGTVDVNLASDDEGFTTAQIVDGNVLVDPDLHLEAQVIFLGKMAEIDIEDLQLRWRSPSFLPDPAPADFSAAVEVEVISGMATAIVQPFYGGTGVPAQYDLVGESSLDMNQRGTITKTGSGWRLYVDLQVRFSIPAPDTSMDFVVILSGDLIATAPDDCRASLFTDRDSISIAGGGIHNLILDTGQANGGDVYWVLGSASGTSPGLPGPPPLPLNVDAYTQALIVSPNTFLAGSLGVLDPVGRGQASLALAPAALDPSLAGLTLHHAHVVFDGAQTKWWSFPVEASNPMPVRFDP